MRKLGLSLTFWLAGILLSTNSFALGLGEIEVNSFLNQPLDAKIEVISERSGEIDDLLVTLATSEAFERAGLSRPRSLSELRFKVEIDEATATAVVLVTTRTAVREPFLNFLVEADWAKGRILREFTVLLDPPFYANTPAPATPAAQNEIEPETPAEVPAVGVIADNEPIVNTAPDSQTSSSDAVNASESEVQPAVIASTSTATSVESDSPEMEAETSIDQQESMAEPAAASTSQSSNDEAEYISSQSNSMIVGDIEVFKGDTLWSIATQFKDPDHSMSQVMLALQQMNPEAFGEGNINILKIGSVLRAPTMDQLDSYGEQEALAEVLEQNGLWDGYVEHLSDSTAVSMAGGDGGDSSSTGTGISDEEQGNLNLLAPGSGESDASGVQGGEDASEELSRQLAFAEEELDAARIENAELESRIAELEATLSKVQELQKMVEIEDDSLAQLQADQNEEAVESATEKLEEASLESITGEESTTTEGTEALTEEMESVDEEALLEELLADDASTGAETESGELVADDGMMVEDDVVVEVVEEVTQPIEVVEEETTATPPPAPVIVTETVEVSDSFLDGILPAGMSDMLPSLGGLLGDPLLLGGVGGVLILLLGLFGYRKWKSKQEFIDLGTSDADEEATNVDDEDLTPIQPAAEADDGTNIMAPDAGMSDEDEAGAAADDFSATEIISADKAAAPQPIAADPEPEDGEQDDTLNEVDVYLAYGLYDNAEDLLKQSLEASPGRADYRSKLLDTYFATKNVSEFVSQAEALKAMGEGSSRYWDRVQVMGYELAPDNDLFSGAKDSTLSAADLGIAKPEAADFDLGGDEDENAVGETDFLLTEGSGDQSADLVDTQEFVETVSRGDDADDAPAESEIEAPAELTEDDLTDLEFAFDTDDEDPAELVAAADDEDMDFELPSDMDDAAAVADESEDIAMDIDVDDGDAAVEADDIAMDFDMDEALDLADESGLEDDDTVQSTMIIKPGEAPELEEFDPVDPMEDRSETQLDDLGDDEDILSNLVSTMDAIEPTFDDGLTDDDATPSDISLGLDDTSDISDEIVMDMEDQTDISDIDLGLDDLASDEIELDGDDIDLDLDSAKPVKTDTFAPGDFDDPEEIVPDETNIEGVNIDDIDDLVLPDDVDEVSTKLDLARAFIDMGDAEGARSSLDEVINEGNEEQQAEAKELLKQV